MLADRRGAIEGAGLLLAEGLELERQLRPRGCWRWRCAGAARFAGGEGRHGEGV
jgi:hypothetical protein